MHIFSSHVKGCCIEVECDRVRVGGASVGRAFCEEGTVGYIEIDCCSGTGWIKRAEYAGRAGSCQVVFIWGKGWIYVRERRCGGGCGHLLVGGGGGVNWWRVLVWKLWGRKYIIIIMV